MALGFLSFICIGTILLKLPISHHGEMSLDQCLIHCYIRSDHHWIVGGEYWRCLYRIWTIGHYVCYYNVVARVS